MRHIHWFSIILFLFHTGGCASDVSLNEPQNVVVKKRSTEFGSDRQSSGLLVPVEERFIKNRSDTEQFFEVKKDSRVNNEKTSTGSSTPSDGHQQKEKGNGRKAWLSDSLLSRDESFEQGTLLQEARVSKDGEGEWSKMAGQEKENFPFIADMLEEEEKPIEQSTENVIEETSHSISRNDSKLTMNSQLMLPSSETTSASVPPELQANVPDSFQNMTGRDPPHWNTSEDLSPQLRPEPESLEVLLDKGKAYLSGGEPEMAHAEFDRLVGLSHDALSYYYRGYALNKLHRYKEAVSDFSQAIQLSRELDTRQPGENSSLVHQPKRDSYRERAFAYYQLQQPRLALADITKFLEMSAGDEVVLTDEYVLRGRVYTALERTELAITDFSEALRFNHASRSQAYIYYLRGLSFFRIKKVQLGLQDMDHSCRLRFENACGFFEQIQ